MDLFAIPEQPFGIPEQLPNELRAQADPAPMLDSVSELDHWQWTLYNVGHRWQIIYFTQPNCPPCETMIRNELPELVRLKWSVWVIDVSKQPFLAELYDVTATPTMIGLVDCEEVYRRSGLVNAGRFVQEFKAAAGHNQPSMRMPREVQAPQAGPNTAMDCRQWRGGWTWPGGTIAALRSHLQGPPHNLPSEWCTTAPPNQLISAHDGWHDANGRSGRRSRRVSYEAGEVREAV